MPNDYPVKEYTQVCGNGKILIKNMIQSCLYSNIQLLTAHKVTNYVENIGDVGVSYHRGMILMVMCSSMGVIIVAQ